MPNRILATAVASVVAVVAATSAGATACDAIQSGGVTQSSDCFSGIGLANDSASLLDSHAVFGVTNWTKIAKDDDLNGRLENGQSGLTVSGSLQSGTFEIPSSLWDTYNKLALVMKAGSANSGGANAGGGENNGRGQGRGRGQGQGRGQGGGSTGGGSTDDGTSAAGGWIAYDLTDLRPADPSTYDYTSVFPDGSSAFRNLSHLTLYGGSGLIGGPPTGNPPIPAPGPASVWLLVGAMGLGGFGAWRRKRAAQA